MVDGLDKNNLKIGFKEVMNALLADSVSKVYIACDCDDKILLPIKEVCNQKGVPFCEAESRKALGKLCSIDVGASCAAVLK